MRDIVSTTTDTPLARSVPAISGQAGTREAMIDSDFRKAGYPRRADTPVS
ncbi:hypothetical protein [Micromonospora sp. NPDC048898]